ncbi:hypothetical protein Pen02_26690 [Plantactinospora endophytica]|uniref:Transposase n=1 Tax=Plantactinospora endophytica TaxID=673535 RepID=A0ABQ4DZ51_9ACTN|nr:hypothetical protein Pen02_26690 [Plantactinospora endophytica]
MPVVACHHQRAQQGVAKIHSVILTRLRAKQRNKEYVASRTAEGRTEREIIRCLERCAARQLCRIIHAALTPAT